MGVFQLNLPPHLSSNEDPTEHKPGYPYPLPPYFLGNSLKIICDCLIKGKYLNLHSQ